MGAPTILDKNETDEILDWIKKQTNKLNPPTRCELSQKVRISFKKMEKSITFQKSGLMVTFNKKASLFKKIKHSQ